MFAVPSQQSTSAIASEGAAHDQLASSTLLSNLCHVTDVAAIAWRAYRFPSPDSLIRTFASTATSKPITASAPQKPFLRAQHALRCVWAPLASASDGLLYTLQQDGSAASPSLLLFVCHMRSSGAVPVKLLPGEEQLAQYAAEADELSLPLSFSARLFSSAFSASVLTLLSAALTETVTELRRSTSSAQSPPTPEMRLILLGNCLCATILSSSPRSSPPAPRPTRAPHPVATAATPSAPPPSAGPALAPVAGALASTVSPSAYLSPPDTGQSLPSPYSTDAVDMVDDSPTSSAWSTLNSLSPRPLVTTHAKAAITDTTHDSPLTRSLPTSAGGGDSSALPPLPPYLAHLSRSTQKVAAYRSPHHQPSARTRSDEQVVQLKPDVLADLALSLNSFPSLSSLSTSTRRSLAIVSPDDSRSTASASLTPSYTMQSADPGQLLGPPPLSVTASASLSLTTPLSMPALSPLVDDDGKLSPGGADNALTATMSETAQQLPFSPWLLDAAQAASDAMDTDSDTCGFDPLTAHRVRFIKQQALAPLSHAFQNVTPSTAAHTTPRAASSWTTVQHWVSGCSLLTRLFSQCRPYALLVKQLSLSHLAHRGQLFSSLHDSLAPSTKSITPTPTLPLVSLPPPRLVFGLESELRDVPAAAVSLYAQSNLRPAVTPKDAVYAVVLPASDAVAVDRRVDVWFDAYSSAYENGGLGRHRPLSGHGRSCVLKLRSIYEVLKERGDASISTPATPASPGDSGTASNTASPRAGSSSMILLSSAEPTGARLALPLSRAMTLHSTAAADGRRRYYQSIVAAVIAELDSVSRGQGAEQLDRFDALVLYILTDDTLQQPHDVADMSDYLSCLYFDRHSNSTFAAALSQLEQMDVVVRLLPTSALSTLSSASFTALSLATHSSIRRMMDRVDNDSEVELPAHVEQLYEPVTFVADRRTEGKEDTAAEAASSTCTLVCVWTVQAGHLLACTCDSKGQVLDCYVSEEAGRAHMDVRECWAKGVQTVLTMVRRHRPAQRVNVQLIEWTDETTSPERSATYATEWSIVLTGSGYTSTSSAGTLPVFRPPLSESTQRMHVALAEPACVTVCSMSSEAAFNVLALHAANPTSSSANTTSPSTSSSTTSRQPLVVEGINSSSTLASHFLPLPPHTLCAPSQRSVPLACGLLFPHRAVDAVRSALSRPVPSPVPAHTSAPLLLSLHDQLVVAHNVAATVSHSAQLLTVAEQLQQLSFLNLPPSLDVGENAVEGSECSALPLPVCIVQRLSRLLWCGVSLMPGIGLNSLQAYTH